MHPHPPQEPSADKNNNRRRLRLKSTSRERTEAHSGTALIQYYLISVYYSEQWNLSLQVVNFKGLRTNSFKI